MVNSTIPPSCIAVEVTSFPFIRTEPPSLLNDVVTLNIDRLNITFRNWLPSILSTVNALFDSNEVTSLSFRSIFSILYPIPGRIVNVTDFPSWILVEVIFSPLISTEPCVELNVVVTMNVFFMKITSRNWSFVTFSTTNSPLTNDSVTSFSFKSTLSSRYPNLAVTVNVTDFPS